MKFTTRELVTLAVFGALWGLVEISLGALLHVLHAPLTGVILAAVGITIALTGRAFVPHRGSTLFIGVIVLVLKLFSIGSVVLGPMVGILVEALLAELILSACGRWCSHFSPGWCSSGGTCSSSGWTCWARGRACSGSTRGPRCGSSPRWRLCTLRQGCWPAGWPGTPLACCGGGWLEAPCKPRRKQNNPEGKGRSSVIAKASRQKWLCANKTYMLLRKTCPYKSELFIKRRNLGESEMRKIVFWILALALLLAGCAQATPTPAGEALKVTDGKTEKSYTAADLKALGASEASFKGVAYVGVPLSALLQDAGFDPATLSAVKATASDGFSVNYEPALFNKEDTLVAYAGKDGPLSAEDGTFRMVLPDQEGKLNPRQLVEIRAIP
jgi:hypothetical protein